MNELNDKNSIINFLKIKASQGVDYSVKLDQISKYIKNNPEEALEIVLSIIPTNQNFWFLIKELKQLNHKYDKEIAQELIKFNHYNILFLNQSYFTDEAFDRELIKEKIIQSKDIVLISDHFHNFSNLGADIAKEVINNYPSRIERILFYIDRFDPKAHSEIVKLILNERMIGFTEWTQYENALVLGGDTSEISESYGELNPYDVVATNIKSFRNLDSSVLEDLIYNSGESQQKEILKNIFSSDSPFQRDSNFESTVNKIYKKGFKIKEAASFPKLISEIC